MFRRKSPEDTHITPPETTDAVMEAPDPSWPPPPLPYEFMVVSQAARNLSAIRARELGVSMEAQFGPPFDEAINHTEY